MNKKKVYDVDYFIKKFEAIPENKWCTHARDGVNGTHCAHGWCSPNTTYASLEEIALTIIAIQNPVFLEGRNGFGPINNGCSELYKQTTPKQRILAVLRDIKAMQPNSRPSISKQLAEGINVGDTSDLTGWEKSQLKNFGNILTVPEITEQ